MHASARQALQLLPKSLSRNSCRIISGRRYPLGNRTFHNTSSRRKEPDNIPNADLVKGVDENVRRKQDDESSTPITASAPSQDTEKGQAPLRASRSTNNAKIVARKRKSSEEISLPIIPTWFFNKNVRVADQPLPDIVEAITRVATEAASSENDQIRPGHNTAKDASEENVISFTISKHIWEELLTLIQAGLAKPNTVEPAHFGAVKNHLLLQCPRDGGIYFLDSIVTRAAHQAGADLIVLDAQDLAEIGGDYLGPTSIPSRHGLRTLAYDVHELEDFEDSAETQNDEGLEDGTENEIDDYEETSTQPSFTIGRSSPISSSKNSKPPGDFSNLFNILRSLGDVRTLRTDMPFPGGSGPPPVISILPNKQFLRQRSIMFEAGNEAKLDALIETFINSSSTKRSALSRRDQDVMDSSEGGIEISEEDLPISELENFVTATIPEKLIIQIRDFKELQATPHSLPILSKLWDAVDRRRKAGQRILIIGTTSSAELMPSLTKSGISQLQSEKEEDPGRTIVVVPERSATLDDDLDKQQVTRIMEINLRHLQDMLRQRLPRSADGQGFLDSAINHSTAHDHLMEHLEDPWSYDRVHRIAMLAQGKSAGGVVTIENVKEALEVISSSDEVKFRWAEEERARERALDEKERTPFPSPSASKVDKESAKKLNEISKICSVHEKKLLGGVINPQNIRTTFNDVCAPPETIESLKTLTTLSLVRPEAFTYGVLATDKIPGLLLYGPPGTGKTLLAKAVAKESTATVLEVSGSEVNDMYVGEGEKNVKAIFSLAKKLTPCVVFIDEADAILGSRSHGQNRTSHRELINQFLKEWDGMNEMGAFIMVATNRPFDLDDAVLRRLPRRLLVDLPMEKDRESILKIHLKDEQLDQDVSLTEIAAKTPLYSGSDLKNLSVAAALACVREENEDAAKWRTQQPQPTVDMAATHAEPQISTAHPSDAMDSDSNATPKSASTSTISKQNAIYEYPKIRTLKSRHFDKALEEISASVSEDMATLAAIRKFDEKYGDRRRKKKGPGWGFGNLGEDKGKGEREGRVRF